MVIMADISGRIPEELKLFIDANLEAYGYVDIGALIAQLVREWAMAIKRLEHKG